MLIETRKTSDFLIHCHMSLLENCVKLVGNPLLVCIRSVYNQPLISSSRLLLKSMSISYEFLSTKFTNEFDCKCNCR